MTAFDITDDVLADLGLVSMSSGDSANVPPSIRWDCSIGSLPFLFAMSDQTPMVRETAQFRRDRVDTERNPGEQSLDSGMWIRSQASWHYGEGITSAEPLEVNEAEAQFRYQRGGGIDPWTAGQLSLLRDTTAKLSASATGQLLLGVNTGVLHAAGTALSYLPTTGASAAVTWGGSVTVQSLTSNGTNWFAGASAGIYMGTLPSGSGTRIYTTSGTTLVRWIKARLMTAVGQSIYEVTNISPSATPAALPTALFTHPASDWLWTDFAEGPTAIYLSGYSGDTSSIYKIGIDATSTTVTLAQPVVVAEMPRGETVNSLYSVVGTYLVICTSKGVRIALMDANGSLSMGPLLVQSSDGCMDAVAQGSYVWVTVGAQGQAGDRATRAGLYRIDLGTTLNNSVLQFAYAADLVAPAGTTGKAVQVTVAGGKLWFAVDGSGAFTESSSYVTEGWLETGRIRMGTVDSKAWRDVRLLSTADSKGTITAFAALNDTAKPSQWTQVTSISTGTSDSIGLLNAAFPTTAPNLFAAFRLSRATGGESPVFIGYQIRSIPAPRRNQLVSVPLLLFDFELARDGVRYGQKNNAFARYQLLKQMEKTASTVMWRDYTTGEAAEAYIEQVSYRRVTPPTRNVGGNGGICTVVLRLV